MQGTEVFIRFHPIGEEDTEDSRASADSLVNWTVRGHVGNDDNPLKPMNIVIRSGSNKLTILRITGIHLSFSFDIYYKYLSFYLIMHINFYTTLLDSFNLLEIDIQF